jgi:octaprenyl-diphosphate synthase
MTERAMQDVNAIIVDRMQSEIELIPTLAGHLVASGGKRVRPMLTLAGAMMAGGKTDMAAKLAASVEFIHTATLLHDDVIDESGLRRGKATANAIWGNEASVLVGDFLFARAFELMVETGNISVLGKLAAAAARITEGEISQMLIAGKPDTVVEDYLSVIIGKTAELFAAAAETGAMVAGGDARLSGMMREYGMELGIAFQIADDALDYQADQSTLGKTVGDDFAEGKTTLPVMIAFAEGTSEERNFWQRTLGEGQIEDGDLAEAQHLLMRHDAIGRTLEKARHHAGRAADQLAELPGSEIRDALMEAAGFAASRAA